MPGKNTYIIRTNPPKILSLKETSIYTGMSISSIRRAVQNDGFPAVRGTYRLSFRLVDIDRWLESKIQA